MSIKLLDEKTINKIAAGEVIENPSNVVKELVENSIDSGAKNIIIEIKDGGRIYIKVSDDGDGFLKEDIKLAFLKHATSKLEKLEDIYTIDSYGFRGEALSSIAAVSKMTLITKRKDGNVISGYKYIVEAGIGGDIETSASNVGTSIIVENLFSNVPVRKKFLKSDSKESAGIYDFVLKFALIKPNISFKLYIDDSLKFKTSGDNNLKNIIYDIYGKDIFNELLEINDEIKGVKINGFIAKPNVARNNRNDEIYFVNNRYIKNDIIRNAIEDAFSEYLMQHKFPLVVLKIYCNKDEVDVNVHPKKAEVRFGNDEVVYYAIYNAIYNVLRNTNLIHEEKITYDTNVDRVITKDYIDDYKNGNNSKDIDSLPSLKEILSAECDSGLKIHNVIEKFEEKPFIAKTLTEDHKYIGQVFDTYILVEFEEKLYIIDQHAAHEKINFEKLMKDYKEHNISSQKIFPSIILKLTPYQYEVIEKNIDEFKKIGFDIGFFGDNDIKIDAVPYNLLNIGKKEFLLDMIDSFVDDKNKEHYDSVVEKIASMSCKKAIKANHVLTEVEVKSLLRELFKLDNPYNCPHGRPTIISLSKYEFERKFGRII